MRIRHAGPVKSSVCTLTHGGCSVDSPIWARQGPSRDFVTCWGPLDARSIATAARSCLAWCGFPSGQAAKVRVLLHKGSLWWCFTENQPNLMSLGQREMEAWAGCLLGSSMMTTQGLCPPTLVRESLLRKHHVASVLRQGRVSQAEGSQKLWHSEPVSGAR